MSSQNRHYGDPPREPIHSKYSLGNLRATEWAARLKQMTLAERKSGSVKSCPDRDHKKPTERSRRRDDQSRGSKSRTPSERESSRSPLPAEYRSLEPSSDDGPPKSGGPNSRSSSVALYPPPPRAPFADMPRRSPEYAAVPKQPRGVAKMTASQTVDSRQSSQSARSPLDPSTAPNYNQSPPRPPSRAYVRQNNSKSRVQEQSRSSKSISRASSPASNRSQSTVIRLDSDSDVDSVVHPSSRQNRPSIASVARGTSNLKRPAENAVSPTNSNDSSIPRKRHTKQLGKGSNNSTPNPHQVTSSPPPKAKRQVAAPMRLSKQAKYRIPADISKLTPASINRTAQYPSWKGFSAMSRRGKGSNRESDSDLQRLRDIMYNLYKETTAPNRSRNNMYRHFSDLRSHLHKLPFVVVTQASLQKAGTMRKLGLIFDRNEQQRQFRTSLPDFAIPDGSTEEDYVINFPWDIQSDAFELFMKWYNNRFDGDLFYGVNVSRKALSAFGAADDQTAGASLDGNIKVTCAYHGTGQLTNGQWFPSRICLMRDGVHGSSQGGIHGHKDKGAYSIVLSGSHYDDQDDGDVIKYSGTLPTRKGIERSGTGEMADQITEATNRLRESYKNGHPVRLIRSEKLPSKYAPKAGYRYDGEYQVVGVEEKTMKQAPDPTRKDRDVPQAEELVLVHIFTLVRKPNQDPIRYQGAEERPTAEELSELAQQLQKLGR